MSPSKKRYAPPHVPITDCRTEAWTYWHTSHYCSTAGRTDDASLPQYPHRATLRGGTLWVGELWLLWGWEIYGRTKPEFQFTEWSRHITFRIHIIILPLCMTVFSPYHDISSKQRTAQHQFGSKEFTSQCIGRSDNPIFLITAFFTLYRISPFLSNR